MENKLSVLLVRVGERAEAFQMSPGLEEMQSIVGGFIEFYEPFEEPVAIVCNDEGKINGLQANRAVRLPDESGNMTIADVIHGDFIVVGVSDEGETISLNEEQMAKYEKMFLYPEVFFRSPFQEDF